MQICCRPLSLALADVTEANTSYALYDVLAALERELSRLGLTLGHALFVHLYLANMGHFAAANNVYAKYFPAMDPPSRACVQVRGRCI